VNLQHALLEQVYPATVPPASHGAVALPSKRRDGQLIDGGLRSALRRG
jgi:hypothetical protein